MNKKGKKYEKDDVITGYVTGIEKYGAFVRIDNVYTGLIHISEISNSFVKDILDYVNIGDSIKAKIIDIDREKHHIKLSIKELEDKKRLRNRIVETPNGFNTLSVYMPVWTEKKITEIEKKNKKIEKYSKLT